MRNRHQDGIFEYLINGLDWATQATLRYMYQHSRMLDEVNLQREKEQFKQEVAEYVISHIKATVDISEVLLEIDKLKKALESLGK